MIKQNYRTAGTNGTIEKNIKGFLSEEDACVALWNKCVSDDKILRNDSRTYKKTRAGKNQGQKKRQKKKEVTIASLSNKPVSNDIDLCFENYIKAIRMLSEVEQAVAMERLVLMFFQIRDCRKENSGKGDRLASYYLFGKLYNEIPNTMLSCLTLLPLYGYWKDLTYIMQVASCEWKATPVVEKCAQIFAEKLKEDYMKLETYHKENPVLDSQETKKNKLSVTLAGKWAPRYGKHFDIGCRAAHLIASILFPDNLILKGQENSQVDGNFVKIERKRRYSKLVTMLSKHLDVVEQKLSSNCFSSIEFAVVPGKALKIYSNAFSCPSKDGNIDGDRKICSENFEFFLKEVAAGKQTSKGTSVNIVTLVSSLKEGETGDLVEAQLMDHITNIRQAQAKENSSLGSGIVLCDVSGSMQGTPMDLSIALGLIVSFIAEEPWKDTIITFENKPTLIDLSECKSLRERRARIKNAPWGGNTNVEAAFSLLLDKAKEHNLSPEQMPKWLMIVSDMQFDQASHRKWQTVHESLAKKFSEKGVEICGKPYSVPMMIYWNARANVQGFPVDSSDEGAQMVSGSSSNLVKLFLQNGDFDKVPTPWQTLVKAISGACYDPVRKLIRETKEGVFANLV